MYLVELLRVRKSLAIYTVLLTLAVAFVSFSMRAAIVSQTDGGVSVSVGGRPDPVAAHHLAHVMGTIPLSAILILVTVLTMMFTTALASSLNKERDNLFSTFTKPISRVRLALWYFAIDAGAILTAFVLAAVLAVAVPIAAAGDVSRVIFDQSATATAVLGFGAALMWFGLVQAATAGYRGSGGIVAGLSWPVFGVLAGLRSAEWLGPMVHGLIVALDVFNPLVVLATVGSENLGSGAPPDGLGPAVRIGLTYAIAAGACGLAILSWQRREV
jgi:hypothetical protein